MLSLVRFAKAKAKLASETYERLGVVHLISSLASKPYFLSASRAELLFVDEVVPWVDDCDLALPICEIFRKLEKVGHEKETRQYYTHIPSLAALTPSHTLM